MKKIINYGSFIVFIMIIILPIVFFNSEEEAISEIDNKYLAQNPFLSEAGGDFTDNFEVYISERLGFREERILYYTIINDKLFDEMIHPLYSYGKDGYVFTNFSANKTYGEYEESFINMLKEIQEYCSDRDIPFVFVFEPSKTSIYADKLPDGYNYNDDWVTAFIQRLDEEGINYVDNSQVMKNLREIGIDGYNIQYNAGHWNDTGAFYGMNEVLNNLSNQGLKVHINEKNEYIIDSIFKNSLMVSEFPIAEYEPVWSLIDSDEIISDITAEYKDEIDRNESFDFFLYKINNDRYNENCVNALVFQGSYINGMGYKFLENGFSEYVGIHDYRNILNFEYYYNIFRPDCVIFDAAQNTFKNEYFNSASMQKFELNPLFSDFDEYGIEEIKDVECFIERGNRITNIKIDGILIAVDYAYYFDGEQVYDLIEKYDSEKDTYFYILSIKNCNFDENGVFYFIDTKNEIKYKVIL